MQAQEIISFVAEKNDDNITRGLYRGSTNSERVFLKSTIEQMLYQALCAVGCTNHFPKVDVVNRVPFDDYEVQISIQPDTIKVLKRFNLWK